MGTVCIVIGIFFAVCVLVGWIRGLFCVMISAASLIVSMVAAVYIAPQLSGFLIEYTEIDDEVAAYISEKLEFSGIGEEMSKGLQVAVINDLPLPEHMKQNILNNNNSEMYHVLEAVNVYDYIAKSIAAVSINAVVFMAVIFSCRLFFFFLKRAAGTASELPILGWMDKLGGGCLGAIEGVLFIWLFFLILSITSTSSWSRELIEQIAACRPLELLYQNNLLLDIVGDLTRVLFL